MTNNIDDNFSHLQSISDNKNYIIEPPKVNKRQREVTEEGVVQIVKKEKKILVAETRQRAKEVQAGIDKHID